ncbi:MAG: phosphate ABC transporter permease PstA [Chloroflexi bacterium]|nr:phosphate ABC transporter permease PstA [Chloroflexota bacterium]
MDRHLTQRIGFALLFLATVVVVVPIFVVIAVIIVRGLPAISWEFLTATPRNGMTEGGIFPALVGTIILTLGTAVASIPVGVGGAIYLAEYASDNWWTRAIRLAIVNLAGVPSVVYGLFGLGLFVLFLQMGTSILAGSLTLAIMTLPVIISAAEEALRAVPVEFRTVSASLGGTRWQGIWRIVLPQALPGVVTGVLLGLLRAAGETAPILFTVVAFFRPDLPSSPFDQTMALPYHLYVVSTQVPGMPQHIQFGTALVLMALVLSMNIVATLIRRRFRGRRQW